MAAEDTRRQLIRILRSAYSGELAAGMAYRAHWRALSNPEERAAIAKIEDEEWAHRAAVGALLARLGVEPEQRREVLMTLIGAAVGISCHLGSWIVPMYFAGRLEHTNIEEYENGAAYARQLGLTDFDIALSEMAAVEREHEAYFLRTVALHPWLPALKRVFAWG